MSAKISVDYGESSRSGESGEESDNFYSNQSSADRYSHDDMMDMEMKFLDTVVGQVGEEVNHLKSLPKEQLSSLLGALNLLGNLDGSRKYMAGNKFGGGVV